MRMRKRLMFLFELRISAKLTRTLILKALTWHYKKKASGLYIESLSKFAPT